MFGFLFLDYSLNFLDFTVKTKAVPAQLPEGNLQWEVVSYWSVSAACVLWVDFLILSFCSHLPCSIPVVRDNVEIF